MVTDAKTRLLNMKHLLLRLLLGVAVGVLCGLIGALFAGALSGVTALRGQHPWVLWLLPLGGIASAALVRVCRVESVSTDAVFSGARAGKPVTPLTVPALFVGSVITHLCGGSAGREGAALQIGGGVAGALSRLFHLDEQDCRVVTLCGMGALFSAVFGTPLGACVFVLEVVRVGAFGAVAFLPVLVSSVTAFFISCGAGVAPERFALETVPGFSLSVLWRVAVIALAGAVVSAVFCYAMHGSCRLFERVFSNAYLRVAAGGALLVALTLLVGSRDYNGAGMEIVERIFHDGTVRYEAFLLKIVFTSITVGAGFKGGEFVPALFTGATLGGAMATLIGLNPSLGAAVGMAALLGGVTACPLATVVLCVELFDGKALLFLAVAAAIGCFLSGRKSLYGEIGYAIKMKK